MDFAYVSSGAPWSAVVLGIVAGFAIAVPLGPIGLLLLREGLAHGFRVAAAGALAVGTVDLLYAIAAVFAGSWVVLVLTGAEQAIKLVGAAVLVAVAVVGIVRAVRAARAHELAPELEVQSSSSAARAFGRFLGLTAINPLTALAFLAIALVLGPRLETVGDRIGFVLGIFVGSLTWQLTLSAIGAILGARVSPRVQTVLQVVGFGIVLVLAVVLAAS
ncbi:MAG: LysE family transporter [Actinomycetota bacterium]|nr:LysE family transporter [Actinomycetota bacterium]